MSLVGQSRSAIDMEWNTRAVSGMAPGAPATAVLPESTEARWPVGRYAGARR